MNWLKKFWITFVSFLPLSAGAVSPFLIGGAVLGAGIIGYSVYRSVAPVNLADALSFFSTCWSCQLFSDIVATMSHILPVAYKALGKIIIPFSIALTAIWFAWQLLEIYTGSKSKSDIASAPAVADGWNIGAKFGMHTIKLLFVAALLAVPLPRLISSVVLEPIFDIGLSMNYTMSAVDSRANYANCIVATAVADRQSIYADTNNGGINAFAPKFRHNLTCQIANVHQMTGLGMTVGWTMLNMAFNSQYMHKILWGVPIFPNIPLFLTGLLITLLFFAALLPIPLYFLEIFMKLAVDFLLLPLTLLEWLFKDWKVIKMGDRNIQKTIDDVISGVLGLAMTGIFITFAIMVLNAVFSGWTGADVIKTAIAQNDSQYLIDNLLQTTGNTALVTIILMGIFMTMFMVMIPALIKSLFNIEISDKYYQTAKKDTKILWDDIKKIWNSAKK